MFFYFSVLKNHFSKLFRRNQSEIVLPHDLEVENELLKKRVHDLEVENEVLKKRIKGFEKLAKTLSCEVDQQRKLELRRKQEKHGQSMVIHLDKTRSKTMSKQG